MRWLDHLHRDPVPWLLDPANPSARYLTLRYIFRKPPERLVDEQKRIMAWEPIQAIRQHWNRFNFWGREENPYYGGPVGNFGTLYLLAQLGAPLFEELELVCENLLAQGRRGDGSFSPDAKAASPWLCYTGMALSALWHFGYGNDLRARSARSALTQAVLLRPELLACPIAGELCHSGMVKALIALLHVPSEMRTAEDLEAIEVLSERLINTFYDFEARDSQWLQPTFPRYYQADLLELCATLAQTPYRQHHRYREIVVKMLALQTEEGHWIKRRSTPALSVERIHHPSRWLTFEAVHALVLTYGDTIYAS